MSKLLWKTLLVSPAVLGATLVVSTGAVRAVDSTSVSAAKELNVTPGVIWLTAPNQGDDDAVIGTLKLPSGFRGNHRQQLPNS